MWRNSQTSLKRDCCLLAPFVLALLANTLAAQNTTAAERDPSMEAGASDTCAVTRPAVNFNRWHEDWSVLANPCLPRQPFDSLKYIPLGDDPAYYLSLGLNLRERIETNSATLFGVGSVPSDTYLIQRTELHADLHLGSQVQIFTQIFDAHALQKEQETPVDANPPNVEQAFIVVTEPLSDGTIKLRVGRQEMAFDLQRFVSVRDGPNVRQSYDAVWLDWETGDWRFIGFASQPVQTKNADNFEDFSDRHLRFNGIRLERQGLGPGNLSAYFAQYDHDGAVYISAAGNERRNVLDTHYAGKLNGYDWDLEAMGQSGYIAGKTIAAWAVGSVVGYSPPDYAWKPRFALQFDAASGNRQGDANKLGTFNPLFPNGYYFTLAGYSGDTNIIHLKSLASINPSGLLTLFGALGFQWRETTDDAVYAQGMVAVPGTAGRGARWTGMYAQLRADQSFTPNLVGSIEAVSFQVGDVIRQAGGRDANYLGLELKFCW